MSGFLRPRVSHAAVKYGADQNRVKSFLRQFHRDEDGVLVVWSVFMFLMMLIVAGIGIDLMRFEMTRTRLQNTLDRAVLAAADLDQQLTPLEVVNDYFSKSGLSQYLSSVSVDQGLNHKQVSATAEIEIDTQYMHMLGQPTLLVPAAGTAEESIDGVEISMVLDVSGSMGRNNRLPNLKVAAKDFVDMLLDGTRPGDVGISIVPYATQVSAGERILSEYNVTTEHNTSHCVNFIADEFNNTAITQTEPLQRTGHFDPWYSHEVDLEVGETLTLPVCPTKPESVIRPISNNRTALKGHIDALTAGGNTSIDIGMKWGAAMLDPGTQPVITSLIGTGDVSPQFTGRPLDYGTGNTLKVVILMTDGMNTNQYYLLPSYRSGDSNVWRNPINGRYSVLHGTTYYYPHDESWNSQPEGGASAQRLTYPELWARGGLQWNVRNNYEPFMGSSAWATWYNGVHNAINTNYKDARLNTICTSAKEEGIIVFTIGFEAPAQGQMALSQCASSPAHYFEVYGTGISDAFAAIASSIGKLRLTQ